MDTEAPTTQLTITAQANVVSTGSVHKENVSEEVSQKREKALLEGTGLLDECLKSWLELVPHGFVLFKKDDLLLQCRIVSLDLDLSLQAYWLIIFLITLCIFIQPGKMKKILVNQKSIKVKENIGLINHATWPNS